MKYILRNEWFGGIIGNPHSYNMRIVNDYTFDYIKKNFKRPELLNKLKAYDIKLIDNGLRIVENEIYTERLSAPIIFWIELTDKCQLRCDNCFLNSEELNKNNAISKHLLKKVITELHENGVYKVTLTGGEALLYENIDFALSELNNRDIGIRLFTNGIVDRKRLSVLSKYDIDILFISLDGCEEYQNKVRGNNTYQHIVKNIEILNNFNSINNITLSVTLDKTNIKNTEYFFEFAEQFSIKTLLLRPIMVYNWNSSEKNDKGLSKIDLIKTLEEMEDLSKKYKIECQINKVPFLPVQKNYYYHDSPQNASLWNILNQKNKFDCVGGTSVCGMKFDGTVIPCGFINLNYKSKLNMSTHSLSKIWQDSSDINMLNELQANPVCEKCEKLTLCNGGCRASAFLSNNSITSVDPLCIFNNNTANTVDEIDKWDISNYTNEKQLYISEQVLVTKCGWATYA